MSERRLIFGRVLHHGFPCFPFPVYVVVLLLVPAVLLFPLDGRGINEVNGHDWVTWSHGAKQFFVLGYFNGMYTLLVGLQNMGYLFQEDTDMLARALFPPGEINDDIDAVDAFYQRENAKEYPLTLVMLYRDQFKGRLLPWKQAVKSFPMWDYKE